MHQPEYRNPGSGKFTLPWTYLHAIKDYTDMAAHLEQWPEAKAVVNFAPVLLEQIDDYVIQLKNFLDQGEAIRDPFLAALAGPVLPNSLEERMKLASDCLRANETHLISRYPQYKQLVEMTGWADGHEYAWHYLGDQFLVDLSVWYHIAWMGETIKRQDKRVIQLIEKGRDFTLSDRRQLLELISELITAIIPRYKKLAEEGKVELSMSPYAHPIIPLLLDIQSAHEAMPDAPLPSLEQYPGGEERADWHVQQGIACFEKHFGFRPQGCWPSEGAVCEKSYSLYEKFGFDWIATGENVLSNSLDNYDFHTDDKSNLKLHRGYRLKEGKLVSFHRDDGLSDMIGFQYSTWHADDAVANFIQHLENVVEKAQNLGTANEKVVSIILDGENAWEYYPENGYHFLNTLYEKLSTHPDIALTTYSECLQQNIDLAQLHKVVAGSWVYGTFSTWIGETDKNRAWDMLGDAKRCYDQAIASKQLSADQVEKATHQLALCEGSDWFWWFGDYNPGDSVSDFDTLYRLHLSHLYELLRESVPEYLSHSFSSGSGAPVAGGVMRPGQLESA